MAHLVVSEMALSVAEMQYKAVQLAHRWKRYISDAQNRDHVRFEAVSACFERNLAQNARQLVSAAHVLRQMTAFENAALLGEEWKGSLKVITLK